MRLPELPSRDEEEARDWRNLEERFFWAMQSDSPISKELVAEYITGIQAERNAERKLLEERLKAATYALEDALRSIGIFTEEDEAPTEKETQAIRDKVKETIDEIQGDEPRNMSGCSLNNWP